MPTRPQTEENRVEIANRLNEVSLSTDRFVSLCTGQKRPDEQWKNQSHRANDVTGNYSIKCGGGLVALDVDDHKSGVECPPEIDDLPPTRVIESSHGGAHYLFKVAKGEIRTSKTEWGDVKSEGSYIVGPGSEIYGTRDGKDCPYSDCCSVSDPGVYTVSQDRPIATVTVKQLVEVPGVEDATTESLQKTPSDSQSWVSRPEIDEIEGVPEDFEPDEVTNEYGMTLGTVKMVSFRLKRLLDPNERLNPDNRYRSISEADMNAAYLLYGWRFNSEDIIHLLRSCRDREGRDPQKPKKMRRDDYAPRTVAEAEQRVTRQIDPELAWALVKSATENDGQGPKASRDTLEITQLGLVEAFHWKGKIEYSTREVAEAPPEHYYQIPSTEWTDITDEARRRRVRRALHILADAGIVERRKDAAGHYNWQMTSQSVHHQLIEVEAPEGMTIDTDGIARVVTAD